MILPHIAFIISYIIYVIFYLKENASLIYLLYLLPIIVYMLLFVVVFVLSRVAKEKFMQVFKKISKILYIFIIISSAPWFIHLNFPDPHNFILRKLEVLLGAVYVIFIFLLAFYFMFKIKNSRIVEKTSTRNMVFYVFSFMLIFYFFISLWFIYANKPTGDETAYLMVAHSMVHDKDIDLKNNFENKDYRAFYDRELQPQGMDIIKNGKIYSYHPLLLSLIIAPFYFIGGMLGVTLIMNIFSAMFVALIFYLCYKTNNDNFSSLLAALLTGFTLPILSFINLVSTEMFVSVLLLVSYILYRYKPEKVVIFSLVMALILWAHIRVFPVYGVIGFLFMIKNLKKPANISLFIVIQVVSLVAFFGLNLYLYGDFMPAASSQTANIDFGVYFLKGLFVYFFDRQLGLFSYAPYFIPFLAGLWLLYKRSRSIALELLFMFIPYYIFICVYPNWGTGNSSPRYLVPILFILSLGMSEVFANFKNKLNIKIMYFLTGLSIAISIIVASVPWFRWDKHEHENWLIFLVSKISHVDFTMFFPSFRIITKYTMPSFCFWIIIFLGLNIYMLTKEKINLHRH